MPINKIFGKNNIWTKVAKTFEKEKESPIDFRHMEQLFCLVAPKPPEITEKKGDANNNKKIESSEINLLDGKRSLNINIFLRQFRSSNEDIIDMVVTGDSHEFEPEKLRGLMKILPEQDEVGTRTDLGRFTYIDDFFLFVGAMRTADRMWENY